MFKVTNLSYVTVEIVVAKVEKYESLEVSNVRWYIPLEIVIAKL